jgi:hypothetical protein
MNETQLEVRKERAENGAFVISRTEEGFRVYSVHNPSHLYLVHQEGDRWTCNCPDYETHKGDSTWRCKHLLAVVPWTRRNGNGAAALTGQPVHEPSVSAEGGKQPPPAQPPQPAEAVPPVPVQMMMKRSVSPDGRIDSISVEFSLPVSGYSNAEIRQRALATLELQKEIVGAFLKVNGSKASPVFTKPSQPPKPVNGDGQPVFARMVDIGKINGKWGDRLCINVAINGRTSRLFGSAKQLAEHIRSAGYEIDPVNVEAGLRLNLACRVVTKLSDDGKYLNVAKVLPLNNKAPEGGADGRDIPY